MKRTEIIKRVSKKTGIPQYDCNRVIDAFQDTIVDALADGEKVVLRGFISFEPRTYAEREGYNPNTGEMEKFESVRTAICKLGKTAKQIINERNREI